MAAALILACTCQRGTPTPAAPPTPPPPEIARGASEPDALGPLRDQAPSFSIALLPLQPPKQDMKAVVAEIASSQYPNLKVQSPGETMGSLPVVIVGGYRSPGLGPELLNGGENDLPPEVKAVLAKPLDATALELHVPAADTLGWLKAAQELAGILQGRVDGVLVDGETQELFDPRRWRLFRMGGWNGDLPAITSQIVLRRNGGNDQAPRLVTFGMAKFGLPDVAAVDRGEAGAPLSARLHLLCQLLVEGQAPAPDGRMTLETSMVREATMKQALTGAGVKGPFQVRLREVKAQPGDPDNRVLDLQAQSP